MNMVPGTQRRYASSDEILALGTEPIPTAPYYDPDFYRLEVEAIFKTSWLQIGHVCELPGPGTYIVRPVEVARASILVTRGPDDVIRAFHNVCTHRGSKVVREDGGGKGSAFTCPYHAWNFGYDGGLRAAPDFEKFFIDKSECALKAVAVDVCAGIIFINLAPKPEQGLRDYLGPIAERLETFAVARATTFSEYTYELDVNWKLIIDNFQENYHLRFVHARTAGPLPAENPFGYVAGFEFMGPHVAQTQSGASVNPGPVEAFGLQKVFELAIADGLVDAKYPMDYCSMFPNLLAFGSGITPFTLYVMPMGPERARGTFRFYWIGDDDSASRRYAREALVMKLRDLHAEDLPSIINSQFGLSSGALDHMHYQFNEVACRYLYKGVSEKVAAFQAGKTSGGSK